MQEWARLTCVAFSGWTSGASALSGRPTGVTTSGGRTVAGLGCQAGRDGISAPLLPLHPARAITAPMVASASVPLLTIATFAPGLTATRRHAGAVSRVRPRGLHAPRARAY